MPATTILSGIRPTGNLHVGNYLGALQNFVQLQDRHECFFFIADLHALNEQFDAKEKYAQVLDTAATFIAAGLDPSRSTIFVQSRLPAHAQLAVTLANFIPVGYLFRMTQYKEKAGKQAQGNANAGLLYYPVLMAADILLYQPTFVPVGDDQDQHVELSRDIAGFFNKRFGPTFGLPKTLHTETPRVMSLLDPTKKMSKTLGGNHCLNLDDPPAVITKKLSRAVTDTGDGTGAGAKNLLLLLEHFADHDTAQRFQRAAKEKTIRYADLKQTLARAISDYLKPIQEKKTALLANPDHLEELLAAGAVRADSVAQKTLSAVFQKIGLRPGD
ncbi:MAG: tryptophanyl-tRNA synthetase [Parcubacteria group bacterium Gr01-1014_31]|nr:MAG: tryptophanyl-tRNA synthetase [Parcubacteria group bacterium Gr01-1014_31]